MTYECAVRKDDDERVQKYQGYIVLVDTIYEAGSKAKAKKQLLDPSFLANLKEVFVEGPKPQHSSIVATVGRLPGMNLFCR